MISDDFLRTLQQDHGIFTLPGLGPFRDSAIRLGHMGVTAAPRCILHTLFAIESVSTKLGYPVKPGTAVNAAEQVYAEVSARQPIAVAAPPV